MKSVEGVIDKSLADGLCTKKSKISLAVKVSMLASPLELGHHDLLWHK